MGGDSEARGWKGGSGRSYLIYQRFRAAFGCCSLSFSPIVFVHIQLLLPSVVVVVIVVACQLLLLPLVVALGQV